MTRERWASSRPSDCDPDDRVRARAAGYEADASEAYFVGRDPRTLPAAELEAMGHHRLSPMAAIRAKCLDCCAGSANEVRRCLAAACPNWPFRTGHNPWRTVSEGRREAGRRLAAKRAASLSDAKSDLISNAGKGGTGGVVAQGALPS
jgi:hypothetical protein